MGVRRGPLSSARWAAGLGGPWWEAAAARVAVCCLLLLFVVVVVVRARGGKVRGRPVPPALPSVPRALCCLWLLTEISLCRSAG